MAIYAFIDGNGRAYERHNVKWMSDADIPPPAIAVPKNIFDDLLDYRWDGSQWVFDPPFDLDQYKKHKIRRLKAERDSAIYGQFTSSALGTANTYDLDAFERNELVSRVVLNVNGKVECTNSLGVEKRRGHSKAEILTVLTDMINAIDTLFATYEARIDAVKAATDKAGVDAA